MTSTPSAISHGLPTPRRTPSSTTSSDPMSLAMDIPRRPSPWHGLAHSLSSTSIGCRKTSSGSVPRFSTPTPPESVYLLPTPPQSSYMLTAHSSRASTPTKMASGSLPNTRSAPADPIMSGTPVTASHLTPATPASLTRPRLSPEHDKAGHIEYKLKLLDPSPERFEKLVTQMLWRLKEGRGEAMYEIGLADDGTVVGLSRNDMELSLRTLELMAAEIGATVIILKEVILAGSGLHEPDLALSPDSAITGAPLVRKKKSRDWNSLPKWKQEKELHAGKGKNKYVVFDPNDLAAGEDGLSSEDEDEDSSPSAGQSNRSGSTSDDGMTFDLDLESQSLVNLATPSSEARPSRLPLSSKKSRRAEERRSARRLDLLRGDGTGPLWIPGIGPEIPHPTEEPPLETDLPVQGDDGLADRDPVLEDMFHDPFATLSLSFADVRLIPAPPLASSTASTSETTSLAGSSAPSSCSSSTHLPSTTYNLDPADKICIEALIVRKNVHGDGVSHGWSRPQMTSEHGHEPYSGDISALAEEGEDDDEWYEYGGADDSWGFGGTDEWDSG